MSRAVPPAPPPIRAPGIGQVGSLMDGDSDATSGGSAASDDRRRRSVRSFLLRRAATAEHSRRRARTDPASERSNVANEPPSRSPAAPSESPVPQQLRLRRRTAPPNSLYPMPAVSVDSEDGPDAHAHDNSADESTDEYAVVPRSTTFDLSFGDSDCHRTPTLSNGYTFQRSSSFTHFPRPHLHLDATAKQRKQSLHFHRPASECGPSPLLLSTVASTTAANLHRRASVVSTSSTSSPSASPPLSPVSQHQQAQLQLQLQQNSQRSTNPVSVSRISESDLEDVNVTPAEHTELPYCDPDATHDSRDSHITSTCRQLDQMTRNADQTKWQPMEIVPEPPVPLSQLQIGDHVYQWRSLLGIPYVFQHHGIVVNIETVTRDRADTDEQPGPHSADNNGDTETTTPANDSTEQNKTAPSIKVTIADFSNLQSQPKHDRNEDSDSDSDRNKRAEPQKSLFSLAQPGILRTVTDQEASTWHKVAYEASFWKRHIVSRAGTSTSKKGDAVGLVLARVHFLLTHPTSIPHYHVLFSNCECVAVWCKTGHWSTLQAASFLEATTVGQVKSTSTLAAAAAHTQVTVPATGVWGWMGYTTKVSLAAYNPYVLPALGAYGALTVGVPAILYKRCSRRWQETTETLNGSFWQHAMDDPNLFAECLTHWSTLPYDHLDGATNT